LRDEVVQYVQSLADRTERPLCLLLQNLGLGRQKFFKWANIVGQPLRHNGKIPKSFWLDDIERDAVLRFHLLHPLEGYRRLAYMMLDANVAAVSPTTVYRILSQAGVLSRNSSVRSLKGTGFVQPKRPHEHWHIDVSYINVCGTFFYLCSILDGFSRAILSYDLREAMTEADVEIIVERARDKYPEQRPRIISDNGPQFISKDFKSYIRLTGMTHVKTSPYYPQSNGKIEAWHKTAKNATVRSVQPRNIEHARQMIAEFVKNYNETRLHSALGYITPFAAMNGEQTAIFEARAVKIQQAQSQRKIRSQA
jgi:transposase InsO family protein